MKKSLTKPVIQSSKLLGVVVLSAALAAGCGRSAAAPQKQAAGQEQQIITVKVAPIAKQTIGEPLEQVADVVSSIQLDVIAKSGGDVQEILKKRGDFVNKGDVIFKIDPTDVQLQREQGLLQQKSAQAQLIKAKQDLDNSKSDLQNAIAKAEQAVKDAEKNYNKLHNDYDAGLATKQQLDQAETQLNNLRMDLDSARKKLKTLETTDSLAPLEVQAEAAGLSVRQADRTLYNLEVKAPVSGVITELPVEVGMTLSPGFRAGQIQQLDPIKIKADLTEAAANLVRGKTELTFYIPGSTDKMKGKVSYLADVMNSSTKAYALELEVPNPDKKLKPGTKAQILLTEEKDQNVVAVPTLSVVREGGDTFLFILNGDHVEKRKVELGRLNETYQEVLSGVKEGEQLVISGQHQLKDQEKVQVAK